MTKPSQWLKSLYRRAWLENFGWHLVIRRFVIGASLIGGIGLLFVVGILIGALCDYYQIPQGAISLGSLSPVALISSV